MRSETLCPLVGEFLAFAVLSVMPSSQSVKISPGVIICLPPQSFAGCGQIHIVAGDELGIQCTKVILGAGVSPITSNRSGRLRTLFSNTQCIPAVTIFASLKLEKLSHFWMESRYVKIYYFHPRIVSSFFQHMIKRRMRPSL